MEAAASHLSGVCSSIQSHPRFLSSPPLPRFISTAWLKSSYKQSVFLFGVPPTISSIRLLLWTLIFSLNGSFPQMDAEKLIRWGSTATVVKRYGLEEYTLWSACGGGGVCVQLALYTSCFIVVFVCGLFTVHVGDLHCWVLLFLCVHQEVRLDYCMCVCVQPLRSRAHYLCMCRCGAVLPPSLVGSWGAAVVPLQISFSVAASALSGR